MNVWKKQKKTPHVSSRPPLDERAGSSHPSLLSRIRPSRPELWCIDRPQSDMAPSTVHSSISSRSSSLGSGLPLAMAVGAGAACGAAEVLGSVFTTNGAGEAEAARCGFRRARGRSWGGAAAGGGGASGVGVGSAGGEWVDEVLTEGSAGGSAGGNVVFVGFFFAATERGLNVDIPSHGGSELAPRPHSLLGVAWCTR